MPHTELINSSTSDLNDQTSSPLTAENLEILSNSAHPSPIKHGSISSKITTVRSGSVEEVFKQVEESVKIMFASFLLFLSLKTRDILSWRSLALATKY